MSNVAALFPPDDVVVLEGIGPGLVLEVLEGNRRRVEFHDGERVVEARWLQPITDTGRSWITARELSTVSAAALHGLPIPPRAWHVEGLIPARTVTLLSGDGGTGKSLLALQLACATALATPWIGHAVTDGPALFLSAEDDLDELHRRLADIARAEGVALADLDRLTIAPLAGEDAVLAALEGRSGTIRETALWRALEGRCAALSPALIVLDTLADLFAGNEIDRAQARQFVGMLRGLAMRTGAAVLLLSHPSQSGMSSGAGTSGSTAWSNSVRSRLYFRRITVPDGGAAIEPDPDRRVLEKKKANYGRTGGEQFVRWQDGVFVAEEGENAIDRVTATVRAEAAFLRLLRELTAQGRRVNPSAGSNYAPRVFASHPDAGGVTKRAFAAAMEALLTAGTIRVVEAGPASRRVTYLEEVQ